MLKKFLIIVLLTSACTTSYAMKIKNKGILKLIHLQEIYASKKVITHPQCGWLDGC